MNTLGQHLSQFPAPPQLILCVDGTMQFEPAHWSERLFDPQADDVDAATLHAHCEALKALGVEVQVVHASDGRTVPLSELNAMKAAS